MTPRAMCVGLSRLSDALRRTCRRRSKVETMRSTLLTIDNGAYCCTLYNKTALTSIAAAHVYYISTTVETISVSLINLDAKIAVCCIDFDLRQTTNWSRHFVGLCHFVGFALCNFYFAISAELRSCKSGYYSEIVIQIKVSVVYRILSSSI